MSLESNLYDHLKLLCPRVYPDVAPEDTAFPYITWQQVGGRPLVMLDGSLPDKRCAFMQINTWAKTRTEANELMLQIETALCNSGTLIVYPQSAIQAMYDVTDEVRGAMQDFEIWDTR